MIIVGSDFHQELLQGLWQIALIVIWNLEYFKRFCGKLNFKTTPRCPGPEIMK
jgi:hypothetical protein